MIPPAKIKKNTPAKTSIGENNSAGKTEGIRNIRVIIQIFHGNNSLNTLFSLIVI